MMRNAFFACMLPLTLLITSQATAVDEVKPETLALHKRLLVLDSHLDTPIHLSRPGWDILARHSYREEGSQVDLPRMIDGGLDGGFWVIYTPPGPRTEEGRAYASHYGLAMLARIRDLAKRSSDSFELALTPSDARRIAAQGKRVVFISMENADPLGSDPQIIQTYYRQGLRMLGLVHFNTNDIADSATALPEWNGLSPKGRELVASANRLGILLDISHASDAVFDQVLESSIAPIIASHSSSKAVSNHPRNLDDARLMQLAAKGGVIQVNSYGDYLVPLPFNSEKQKALAPLYARFRNLAGLSPEQVKALQSEIAAVHQAFPQARPDLDAFMKHLLHVLDVVGPQHVGIGADWDGGGGVVGLEDVSQLPKISERLLHAGYSEKDLANIWGENLLRVLQAAQDAAQPERVGL